MINIVDSPKKEKKKHTMITAWWQWASARNSACLCACWCRTLGCCCSDLTLLLGSGGPAWVKYKTKHNSSHAHVPIFQEYVNAKFQLPSVLFWFVGFNPRIASISPILTFVEKDQTVLVFQDFFFSSIFLLWLIIMLPVFCTAYGLWDGEVIFWVNLYF